MGKSEQYALIRKALESNQIENFDQLVALIPKTRIAKVTGANNGRITKCIETPWLFTLQDLTNIADELETEDIKFIQFVLSLFRKSGKKIHRRRTSKDRSPAKGR